MGNPVEAHSRSLAPFFLLSGVLHLFLVLAWPRWLPEKDRSSSAIPVALIPALPGEKPDLRGEESARKNLRPSAKSRKNSLLPNRAGNLEPAAAPAALAKEPVREALAREERGITPTLKELLPPITWSRGTETEDGERPVPLNSREPRYVSYLTSVKRAIEIVWEYPETALRRGIEGKLVLEFTILGNGGLSGPALVQSSGYKVLDDEAIRAVRAAAPFSPIPPGIGKNRLLIVATLEYHDHRVKYGPLR